MKNSNKRVNVSQDFKTEEIIEGCSEIKDLLV